MLAIAILAAGKGTRMRSQLPKVLHPLAGRPILQRVIEAALPLIPDMCHVIVGYGQAQVEAAFPVDTFANCPLKFVQQAEQKGTGHAVMQLLPHLEGYCGDLIVLNGDVPLLRADTLKQLWQQHQAYGGAVTLLSAQISDPTGYGRVFCDAQQRVTNIVEHRDCSPAQLRNNRVNAGIYCFRWPDLAAILPHLNPSNAQNEYYLTDAIALLQEQGTYAVDVEDVTEIQGVNDRQQLAIATDVFYERIKIRWMQAGVTLIDPDSITIDDTVVIEPDAIIEPQTHLRGQTQIAQGCRIGPGSLIENSVIAAHSRVLFSVVSDSYIGSHSTVGPYAHIRGEANIGDQCRIGNFVEVKHSRVGNRTNAAHLSYLGDASLGEQVNIGAGTITANFDGKQKHATVIGDRSKTGSNSVLVAPVSLGSDVTVAAGSVVTESVEDDALVIARARQVVKPGWRPTAASS